MRRTLLLLLIGLAVVACGAEPLTSSDRALPDPPQLTSDLDGSTTLRTATTANPAEDSEATDLSTTTVPADRGSTRPLPPVVTVPPNAEPPAVTGEVPAAYMAKVLANAADRANVAEDAIAVLRSQQTLWPDGSLGCGEPGGIYTQAVVSGYWVELSVSEIVLDYRLDSGGNFVLCEGSRPRFPPTSAPGDTTG